MSTTSHSTAFWVLFGAVLLSGTTASAYDAKRTHRWITRMAAAHLVDLYGSEYADAERFVDAMAAGNEAEDDNFLDGDTDPTTLRVQRHFYRPTDRAGLTMSGQSFPSSLQWGARVRGDNEWGWDDAITAYQAGDYETAFMGLGHIVHLIQDLTVPAHTHLDVHGPPHGDDYEAYCFLNSRDEFDSDLPKPAPGTPIPQFVDLDDAWDRTAWASYWRNMYWGDLRDTTAPAGDIKQAFPEIRWSWIWSVWTISTPEVGDLEEDFFEHLPGWYYFKNAEHPATFDRHNFDVDEPERIELAPNVDNKPMVELFARDLIPVAVLHSAAVMKMFIDATRDLPPLEEPAPTSDEWPEPAGCAAGTPSLLFTLLPLAARLRRRAREVQS